MNIFYSDEQLDYLQYFLEKYPNVYIDIAARLKDFPAMSQEKIRKLFIKYADRILFGTDMGPQPDVYRLYFRFLETDDEYFNYDPQEPPSQGRWRVYGLSLPDEVLEKVYHQNAEKIFAS